MKTLIVKVLFIKIYLLFIQGCAILSVSDIQSAKLINKGEIEITPSVSTSAAISKQYGIQCAYGLSKNLNLRMRIEKNQPIYTHPYNENEIPFYFIPSTHLSVGLKYNIKKDKIALYLPFSHTTFDWTDFYNQFEVNSTDFKEELDFFFINSISFLEPTLLFSLSGKYLELNPAIKIIFNKEILLNVLNVGLGFSTNYKKWALRPEFGILLFTNPDFAAIPSAGLGLSINLNN